MQRVLMLLLLASLSVFANEGKAVYEKKCASCHELYVAMDKLEENFMVKENKVLKLKAPTMNQIVYRLKSRIGDPNGDKDMHMMEIESFLSDYFQNPDKQKSVCMAEVLKYFDTMPAISLEDDELEAIVSFLYEYDPKSFQKRILNYETYNKALKEAASQNKMVMIFFGAKHCPFCKKMERDVLSDSDVIANLEKLAVVVKIDMDHEKSPVAFKPKLTPTFLFLTPNGEEVYRVPGAWPKGDFLQILKEAKTKYNNYVKKEEKK